MKSKLTTTIKKIDLFGHQFKLTYQGKRLHQTFVGGLISMVVIAIMSVITFKKTKQMLFHLNDSVEK